MLLPPGVQPGGYGLPDIGFQFLRGVALADAAGQVWNLGPVSIPRGFVDFDRQFPGVDDDSLPELGRADRSGGAVAVQGDGDDSPLGQVAGQVAQAFQFAELQQDIAFQFLPGLGPGFGEGGRAGFLAVAGPPAGFLPDFQGEGNAVVGAAEAVDVDGVEKVNHERGVLLAGFGGVAGFPFC